VGRVWEYLDWAYMRQDVFLHNLMKPVHAFKELGETNYRSLEEYLEPLLRTFDIAEEAWMLPIILHQNNLRPMYKKWPHGPKWWTNAERFNIMDQPMEFHWYIKNRYYVVAIAISSMGKGGSQKDDAQKPKEGQGRQGEVESPLKRPRLSQ
jgi:hypothetical protein